MPPGGTEKLSSKLRFIETELWYEIPIIPLDHSTPSKQVIHPGLTINDNFYLKT